MATTGIDTDAPRFTPEEWNKSSVKDERGRTVLWGANCFQYAFAGSDPAGKNVVYHEEAMANPGELTGHLFGSKRRSTFDGLLNIMALDGIHIVGKQELPPPKPDYYLVGVYLHEGHDYHFVRADADGGWSDKAGQGVLVARYLEPNSDGSRKPLPMRYGQGDYQFIGYTYAPKEGINFGLETPVARSLIEEPGGEGLKEFFRLAEAGYAAKLGKTIAQYYDPEVVALYESAREKFKKPMDTPAEAAAVAAGRGASERDSSH